MNDRLDNPFPGMNPWLERFWGDLHTRLISYAADAIQEYLPGDLVARMQERVFVEYDGVLRRGIEPDLVVAKQPPVASGPARGGVAMAEPLVVQLTDDPVTERFIEILTASGEVVTVIELLSPANKYAGPGHELYVQKRQELYAARVSLVEVDLLRAGPRVLSFPSESLPASHRTPYQVCVHRGWQPLTFEIYRLPLREPLAAIRVPLREGEADVPLDLQALVDTAYRRGRYGSIDYRVDPVPPLSADDAKWADQILRGKGLR
jgi:hypothetical protein